MFDFDLDLDLGSRRKPTQWVAVAPASALQQNKPKRRARQDGRPESRTQSQEKKEKIALKAKAHQDKAQALGDRLKHKQEQRDDSLQLLEPEDEEGNVEYKYRIADPNPVRYQQLVTQMKFRLSEGSGECYYYVGVEDDGYPRGLEPAVLQRSLETLQGMARGLWATAEVVNRLRGASGRECLLVHIAQNTLEDLPLTDLRIAVAGGVDCGKSSLIAVLTHGVDGRPLLDNGRGAARMKMFRHKHEIESGRTSSISQHAVGYDSEGRVLNYAGVATPTLAEISSCAARLLTLIDIGGHQKYAKTALYSLTAMLPDYMLLACCAATGPSPTTRHHLALAIALEIPTAILLTKVDMADEEQQAATMASLRDILEPAMASLHTAAGQPLGAKGDVLAVVDQEEEAVGHALQLAALHIPLPKCKWQSMVPVFPVSGVSGSGLPTLHAFLRSLEPAASLKSQRSSIGQAQGSSSEGGLHPAPPQLALPCASTPWMLRMPLLTFKWTKRSRLREWDWSRQALWCKVDGGGTKGSRAGKGGGRGRKGSGTVGRWDAGRHGCWVNGC